MDDNKDILQEIKELFQRLADALKKWRQGNKPAVFEKELKAVEKKLEQFEEQDEIHTDALRDVAQTLERITGSIENGMLHNGTAEEVTNALALASKQIEKHAKRGSEPYVVNSKTLDDILQKAFGKEQGDFYVTAEDGQRTLSPRVKFAFDKHDGKKADVYMLLDGANGSLTGVKINVSKGDDSEKITFEKSNIRCSDGKYELANGSGEFELMQLDSLRSRPLEEIIGEALFQSSEEYMKARIEKGYKMAEEWSSISGTKDKPFTMDEFQCIHNDEGNYCIKDRLNDTMMIFSYDREEKSFSATFYSDVKEGFDVSDKEGETALKIQKISPKKGQSSLSYSIATSPNADKILDTEMAQKVLHMIVPDENHVNKINDARNGHDKDLYWGYSGGELVQDANRDKVIMLRNEIEEHIHSQKGLEDYHVSFRSSRHGKESQIVITAPNRVDGVNDSLGKSEYVINFDKKGNIKSHLWGSYDLSKGKRGKLKPIVSTSNNFIDKVLDKEGFSREDLCLCYQVTKESLQAVDVKLAEMGMKGFSQDLGTDSKATDKAIQEGSLVQEWTQLAEDAILATNMNGKIDDERALVNLILEQAERRDGTYPNAEYKEALSKNVNLVYYELAERGVIDNTYSRKISPEYQTQKFEAVRQTNEKKEPLPSYADIPDSLYDELANDFYNSDSYKADMKKNYETDNSSEKTADNEKKASEKKKRSGDEKDR